MLSKVSQDKAITFNSTYTLLGVRQSKSECLSQLAKVNEFAASDLQFGSSSTTDLTFEDFGSQSVFYSTYYKVPTWPISNDDDKHIDDPLMQIAGGALTTDDDGNVYVSDVSLGLIMVDIAGDYNSLARDGRFTLNLATNPAVPGGFVYLIVS